MNILFISSLYSPHIGGGAEIVLQRTAEGLQRRGCQVSVLVTGPDAGLSTETVNDIKVYRAGLRNFYWPFGTQRPGRLSRLGWHLRDRYNGAMRNYVKQVIGVEQPQLVVCHNLSGWSVSVWDEISAAQLPIVQVLHDMYLMCPGSNMFKRGQCCQQPCSSCQSFRKGHDARSAQVSAVVGVSRFMLDTLQKSGYFSAAKGYVVHNASPYAPVMNALNLQRRLDPAMQKAPLRYGYMGTLSAQKGVGWLIEQFQRLPLDATLQIAGRGQVSDEAAFRALATSSKISFVGYQKPETFYGQIDVAVVPSMWNEPFGMVAVEACAHSVPVIASRMGGLPEIIQEPLNGLLCDPSDPDSLGDAMLRLHQQPELLARLSRQSRVSVGALLNLEAMLDSYESIFTQTVQDHLVHRDPAALSPPV